MTQYEDIVKEMRSIFSEKVNKEEFRYQRLELDPGFGFTNRAEL
jgi:dihydropteroate synthase